MREQPRVPAPPGEPSVPMRALHDACDPATPGADLLVLLPGAYGTPEDFVAEGFVDAVRRRAIAADIVMADAHFGYFTDRSVVRRVREDIVMAARDSGRRRVWLAGISLGGLAALGYAARHGDELAGVVAIAPYPGSRELLAEIASAGGPAGWRARLPSPTDDLEREVWAWLAGYASNPSGKPAVHVGYGRGDRFAGGQAMLAGALAPEHVYAVDGGHEWGPWREVWESWLDRGPLCRDSRSGALRR